MKGRSRAGLLLVFLLLLINLPLAHSSWLGWRLDRDGVETSATLVKHDGVKTGGKTAFFVQFRLSEKLDPKQEVWSAPVSEAAYDEAVAADEVQVRVLPGHVSEYQVKGQLSSSIEWWLTGIADLILLLIAGLAWRFRPGSVRLMHIAATEDLRRCKPGSGVERLDGGVIRVWGEVAEMGLGSLILEVGSERVRVDLAGHANPARYQQPVEVIGREI